METSYSSFSAFQNQRMAQVQVLRTVEKLCKQFAKGIGDVFSVIHVLIPDEETTDADGISPSPEERPAARSELARRRAERLRARGETPRYVKAPS